MNKLGVALSGGGSRAAAFHCGTLKGLERLRLLPSVAVVSSVSGGSVFAAAWAAGVKRGEEAAQLIGRVRAELRQGFIWRALLRFPWFFGLAPLYPRTRMLAKVFSSLSEGMTLGEMAEHPQFVFNTTVLNSGQIGKFVRGGFSAAGLGPRQPPPADENPIVPCTSFPVALAAAASAAFPIGLPPLLFHQAEWFPHVKTESPLKGHTTLALTDGGVLENLGAQTLLKSRTFKTDDIIASDAGTRDHGWQPRNLAYWLLSCGIWLASGGILARFMATMNDKENRWMRERLFDVATAHSRKPSLRRNVLLVRIASDWDQVVGNASRQRLEELAGDPPPEKYDADFVRQMLSNKHPERSALLDEAFLAFQSLSWSISQLNALGTHFCGMSAQSIDALAQHAYWQTLATFALYWEPWPPGLIPSHQQRSSN